MQGQAQVQSHVQAEVQVEGKEDVVKWHKSGCVIQGLDVLPDKAPPTKAKAKIRYDCFEGVSVNIRDPKKRNTYQ